MCKILLFYFLFITIACKAQEVSVYAISFETNYYQSITALGIKSHRDASKVVTKNKCFFDALNDFVKELDTNEKSEYNSLDVRVQLILGGKNFKREEISLDKFGDFLYKEKIYKRRERLISIIEKHTKINFTL